MDSTRSRLAAVCTALLVLFLAVAIYTPLHQHKAGNPYQCSLNNVDQAVAEAAVAVAVLLVVLVRVAAVTTLQVLRPDVTPVAPLAGRGPPAF
jgi:hypothetical protein